MKSGIIISAAVASLFASAVFADNATAPAAAGAAAKVHCSGVNSCKGMGSCKTASNACKGQNSCKGKGMMEMNNAKECTDKGGKVEETK